MWSSWSSRIISFSHRRTFDEFVNIDGERVVGKSINKPIRTVYTMAQWKKGIGCFCRLCTMVHRKYPRGKIRSLLTLNGVFHQQKLLSHCTAMQWNANPYKSSKERRKKDFFILHNKRSLFSLRFLKVFLSLAGRIIENTFHLILFRRLSNFSNVSLDLHWAKTDWRYRTWTSASKVSFCFQHFWRQ